MSGRKTKTITLFNEHFPRDNDKRFVINEMPSHQAEKWAHKACKAYLTAGGKLPDETYLTMASVASMNLLEVLPVLYASADDELLDELMDCVLFDPEKSPPRPIVKGGYGDIEEIITWTTLRLEVLALHVGFSLADMLMTMGLSASQHKAAKDSIQPMSPTSHTL